MRSRLRLERSLAAATLGLALLLAPGANALETVSVGLVGAASAAPWAVYIGVDEGFFAAEGIEPDIIYAQSVGALIQQAAASSLDMVASAGLVDPIYAIEHGAPVAIVRIEGQVAPYALLGNAKIKSLKELRGKTISIDETTGITRTYLERMLVPNGLKRGDYDLIYAGATSARYAALQSGAADAAMLNPPASFMAVDQGYTNLGFVQDFAKDLPFSGIVVNKPWAASHQAIVRGFLAAYTKSILWFYDAKNREAAMTDLIRHTKQKPDGVAVTYDFFQKIAYFEPSGKVSLKLIGNIVKALQDQGAVDAKFDVNRLIMPGLTELAPQ
jgi:NitT/TauT family transport system substrate-binding protein